MPHLRRGKHSSPRPPLRPFACALCPPRVAWSSVRGAGDASGDAKESGRLQACFTFQGTRIALVNPQRGIFKPRVLARLLSIRTVYPKSGARVWYDDQREVHAQLQGGAGAIDYAFMGQDPDAADNRWLREAYEDGTSLIYFLGIAPGQYQAVLPAFVGGWDRQGLKAQVVFGEAGAAKPPATEADRRYALRQVRQRLHQAEFRAAVIAAYGGRCALSRLPEPRLLDAAHIVADGDEALGQPVVPNGLPLSKIHHAAFDAHLLGIDADGIIHVAEALMAQQDGPVLEAMKGLQGSRLVPPRRAADAPDRDRLARRFELFRAEA